MNQLLKSLLIEHARRIDEIDNLMRVRRASNDTDSQTVKLLLDAANYIELLEKRLEVIEDLIKRYEDKSDEAL